MPTVAGKQQIEKYFQNQERAEQLYLEYERKQKESQLKGWKGFASGEREWYEEWMLLLTM